MRILITNDDGYNAKGIRTVARIMKSFGEVNVVGPKRHQSGMALAVDLGLKQLAYKDLGETDGIHWSYLDATPASCAKYGINFMVPRPDLLVSGINHGSNATAGALYSGTLGACQEAVISGIPAIGVSLDSMDPDADFSAVEALLPGILQKLIASLPGRKGSYYNINFPALPLEEIKGIRVTHMGEGHWIKEFSEWNPGLYSKFGITPESLGQKSDISLEEGEELYMMVGEYVDSPENTPGADHHILKAGYVTITCHTIQTTDYQEIARLRECGFDIDFQKQDIE